MTSPAVIMDKVIQAAFPGWGVRRSQARRAQEMLDTLAPLKRNRGGGGNAGTPTTLDQKIPYGDRLKMIDLFDTQLCESPLLASMIDQFVRNVVPPTGLRPIPNTGNVDFDHELSARFDGWADDCEARGHSFWQLEQILLKSVLGHGDAGILSGVAGDSLQGIPAAKVATPTKHARHEGSLVHQGVYTGSGLRPRGYYAIPRDRWGAYRQEQARYLPAERVWWFSRATDFESYRGASAFLASFPMLHMANSIMQYKAMQVKMASVFGLAITKDATKATSPIAALGSAAERRGEAKTTSTRPDIELFSGMGITLNPDEDLKVVESKIAAGDFEQFVYLVARYVGIACGLPLEFVLLDWTKANYYGNRMSATLGMRAFLDWWTVPARLARVAYGRQVDRWLADGTIVAPSVYDRDPRLCTVTLPPPIDVDDEKALKVWRQKIEGNLASEEDWARSQGDTLSRILASRKRSLEQQQEAGLPIVATSTPGVKLLSELENDSDSQ